MTARPPSLPRIRIRLVFAHGAMLGPGKADLLGLIAETGSISAAGRRMGMSYKRAWGLVETMNAMFDAPLVESVRGGASGGGARLTPAGQAILDNYRRLEARCAEAGAAELQEIAGRLSPSLREGSEPAEPK